MCVCARVCVKRWQRTDGMSSVFLSSPLHTRGSDMFLSTVSVRGALTGEVPGDEHGGQNGTLRTKKAKTEVKGGNHLMCHEVTLSQWNRYKKQPCFHSRWYFKASVLFLIYYSSHLFSLSVTSHVFARLLVLHYYQNWTAFCTREQNVPKYLPPSRTRGAKCCERCGCWV